MLRHSMMHPPTSSLGSYRRDMRNDCLQCIMYRSVGKSTGRKTLRLIYICLYATWELLAYAFKAGYGSSMLLRSEIRSP